MESKRIIFKDRVEWRNEIGELHRIDGPSIEHINGAKEWHQYDKRHRLDGTAVEFASGLKCWYYDGERFDCTSQEEFERLIKLKAFW